MAYVNPLDPTTPLGSDAVSQGDDMFRLVKAALIERMDSFFTGHDVQPWQAKSGSGAASLWIVSDAVEAVTRLAYTGAGSRSVELFANATVAGLRDTTGPLTILSYTYSSALTVLNTTGSMQLKVGVGQTIQTVVNSVTIGTWSAAGVTIASGTLTLGATAAVAGLIRLPNQNTISWRSAANNDDLRLWVNFSNVLVFDNASAGTPQAISVGAITAASGLTVSAGGLTVASGTTSLQATVATQLAATSAVTNGASRTTLSFGDIAGTGRVTAYGANAATIGVLDFVLLSSDGSVGYAPAGRMTGGVFGWGTTVTTSAGQGDIVLALDAKLRSVDNAGTNTYELVRGHRDVGSSSNLLVLGGGGLAPAAFAMIAAVSSVSLPAWNTNLSGLVVVDITNNRLCYYTQTNRYYLTGTAF